MVNYSTNINKTNNHLSSKQWWSTILPVSTKQTITSHLKSLNSDGQLFYQYQQNKQSPLT